MLIENDPYRAFMPYDPVSVAHSENGPLAGMTLAVKDIFDVAGYRTGCGCPLRLAQSGIATRNAAAVQRLLDAGARCVGKTHTDELAWSMYGMNAHFGTPVNPAAPDRIPGGSSSGSAVAVAGGLTDIAIGSDTGGSIRAPASFCGIWGIRTTHDRVSLEGALSLAPSFDTAGLFARDGATLAKAAAAMMDADETPLPDAPDFLWPEDMVAQLAEAPRSILRSAFGGLPAQAVQMFPNGLAVDYATYLTAMMADCREAILPFIRSSGMPLVRGIEERAAAAEALTETEIHVARAGRAAIRDRSRALLGPKGVILAPAAHDAPFRLDAPLSVFDEFRHQLQRLFCVAGMAGLPQVVFPAGQIDGAPIGLSLIGPAGSDLSLIAHARRLSAEAVS